MQPLLCISEGKDMQLKVVGRVFSRVFNRAPNIRYFHARCQHPMWQQASTTGFIVDLKVCRSQLLSQQTATKGMMLHWILKALKSTYLCRAARKGDSK